MHYYFATYVSLSKDGWRSGPTPITVRAWNAYEAEDKIRERLGDGKYEIQVAEAIGYDD